jgi:sugar phosphate isomerase/epimerase
MKSSTKAKNLAVCSWSLIPTDPYDLIAKLKFTGINRVQLALDPLRELPAIWGDVGDLLNNAGITIVSGMFSCVGEDYSSLDSIRLSGGIVPDATWDKNLENIRATLAIAVELKLNRVSFHAGFVSHDSTDPNFTKMLKRLATVAEIFASEEIAVGLETGQETATELKKLLETLQFPNLFVNFDPANMLLYGKGNPIEAMSLLKPWIGQVHIKDAIQSQIVGEWGEEVVVGSGDVDWQTFFSILTESNFSGEFVIEREVGDQRVIDVGHAREVILKFIR